MSEGPNAHRHSLTRWPRFSLARLFVGVSVTALGMGAIVAMYSYEIRLGRFGELALFACFGTIWAGICLPFMRTVYALVAGCVLGFITFHLFVIWAFSSISPPPAPAMSLWILKPPHDRVPV